ncbi:hypothetical protein JN11_04644 [Mucilaginibacter frigoritolerans]|uniref:Uncharacterized protein n=1 Tax=Mucilaginibacter frigoritolerans TaxID=652788 RepID=A0A562TMN8_9SPHI|nr:hypothetical protein [Mucilaginibacter frigoritolerans]TWI94534.1 hypothetical protein JN11_04644 [Mucilaginibacter frigoritolerans]
MKNKKLTYVLGLAVLVVWGMIIYRVFNAAADNNDDATTVSNAPQKKEPYNDETIVKDTTHLLLNYRDPFSLIKLKDTAELPVKKILSRNMIPVPAKPAFNWGFIRYAGYIRNPATKKLVAMVSINGKNEMFVEGQTKDQVKLLKNLRDSIKISYSGKVKFIPMSTSTL